MDNMKGAETAAETAAPRLEIRAGARYRNPQGIELRAVELVDAAAAARLFKGLYGSFALANPGASALVLGSIWVMESVHLVGSDLALVTEEGLAANGYRLVEE